MPPSRSGWTARRHGADDKPVFNCVIVITDRRVLDKQLQDAIYQIEHQQGVVRAIDEDSKQLAAALIDGTKIVITTLQKFPFVLRGLLHAAGAKSHEAATKDERDKADAWKDAISARRYAVIVDEAHSSFLIMAWQELGLILTSDYYASINYYFLGNIFTSVLYSRKVRCVLFICCIYIYIVNISPNPLVNYSYFFLLIYA